MSVAQSKAAHGCPPVAAAPRADWRGVGPSSSPDGWRGTDPLLLNPRGYRITRIDPAAGGMATPFAANTTPLGFPGP